VFAQVGEDHMIQQVRTLLLSFNLYTTQDQTPVALAEVKGYIWPTGLPNKISIKENG